MTVFLLICAVMVVAAIVLVVRPLWHRSAGRPSETPAKRLSLSLPFVVGLPVAAVLLYSLWSNFDWNAPAPSAHGDADVAQMEELLGRLEQRLAANPEDLEGWVMLARSSIAIGQFGRAADAYGRANELAGGENPDIATGYAEALALVDEASLAGRAGQIFEAVLKEYPDHPKALWYGSIIALRSGNLPVARDRMQRLLAMEATPPEIRSVLEQQLADVAAQLGDSSPARIAEAPPPTATEAGQGVGGEAAPGSIAVQVSIAPELAARLDSPRPVFVLARDADAPGPPLAAARRMSNELPLVVELSDANAMIAGRTMADAGNVEIVARVSKSGMPTAQSGDLYGSANYAVDGGGGRVSIVIDQVVP